MTLLREKPGVQPRKKTAETGQPHGLSAPQLCHDPMHEFVDFVCRPRRRQFRCLSEAANQPVHTASIIPARTRTGSLQAVDGIA
jgi:hypothetical protein